MGSIKQAFGASSAITCTLASLASSATVGRESTAIDNTSDLYTDALVQLVVKLQTGTPANDKTVYCYVYGSEDGTEYTDGASGSDAGLTLNAPPNMVLLGSIYCPDAGGLTWRGHPWRVAPAFGGVMPRKWGIVVLNYTGVALSATEGDHSKTYTGLYHTS